MKKLLLLFVLLLLAASSFAIEVEIGGLWYDVVANSRLKEAKVIQYKNNNKYSGNIVIPETVEYEGETCSVTSIDKKAFYYCNALYSVTIGNSVTNIGILAFSGCSHLSSVTIGNSVTSIGNEAFYYCSALTSVTIGNSVTSIGNNAFEHSTNLTSVHISNLAAWCGIFFGNGYANPLCYASHLFVNGEDIISIKDLVIPNSVTNIGTWTFCGFNDLTSVTIPSSVTSIGVGAFAGCKGLTSVHITDLMAWCRISFSGIDSNPLFNAHLFLNGEEIKDLVIPNSVTSIGEYAFCGCSGLTSVTIPNSVTSIGNYAFRDCSSLTSVTIPNSVTSIGGYAFYGCSGLTSVTIPNSVTSIGDGAFNDCSGLKRVTLNCKEVGSWFANIVSIKEVVLGNGVASIGEKAFNGCLSLLSVTIPNGVKSIGQDAFRDCTGLASVTIPNSVTSIGYHAFMNCSSLTSITIPNSVLTIGSYLFSGCTSLTSIKIPNSVKIISTNAFSGCSGLKEITIGSDVGSIYTQAFADCPELTDVYCFAEKVPRTISSSGNFTDIFEGSYIEYATLHVPEASIRSYGAVEPWKNFKNIVKIDMPKYKLTYVIDGIIYKTYEIEEGKAISSEAAPTKEGYTFSGWIEIPETMPAHDVTVTGTFTINSYTLTYMVDGKEYKKASVKYGSSITAEAAPTKEGYTFSGWSGIPETMPAHDVMVTGTFSINSYTLTYMVDGVEYKTVSVKYGSTITAEAAPTKEGYTFSGWSEIPETMPAHDVVVTGTFAVNSYTLTYMVDGVEYKTASVKYGSSITAETAPTKEGYTFSGWSEIPATMPAHDVTITGTFTINKYKVTFVVDGQVYGTTEIEYGADVNPIGEPSKEGYTFSGWQNLPEDMPAHDITVTGTFTVNQYKVTFKYGRNVLTTIEVDYGAVIPLPESLNSERYTLIEWLDVPETMPARDIIIYADYIDGIDSITADSKDVQYIQMNGMYTNELKQGLNIIHMSDGTTKKVWVK
jgi:hypothetical protein